MRIGITGATGLVGSELTRQALELGHTVTAFSRSKSPERAHWDPAHNEVDAESLANCDAVIHLAGENIGKGRWTAAKKDRIRSSRVDGTHLIANTMANLDEGPRVLINASAIGYYGDRGDEIMTEESYVGSGYLADVCREWEDSCQPAIDAGIRCAKMRIGVVLSKDGGALAKMLLPFRLGGGGVIGNGKQYMSWIAIEDVAAGLLFALDNENAHGPINLVSPNPVTNREFTKTLGRVLSRPTVVPLPGFAAKLAFGEMAEALLLSSTRVIPAKLNDLGFSFRHPDLEQAMRHILDA